MMHWGCRFCWCFCYPHLLRRTALPAVTTLSPIVSGDFQILDEQPGTLQILFSLRSLNVWRMDQHPGGQGA